MATQEEVVGWGMGGEFVTSSLSYRSKLHNKITIYLPKLLDMPFSDMERFKSHTTAASERLSFLWG